VFGSSNKLNVFIGPGPIFRYVLIGLTQQKAKITQQPFI